jgi:DNA replication protein DnaC
MLTCKTKSYSRNLFLEHARIPEKFRDATIDKTHSPAVYKFAQKLEHNLKQGYGLLLTGPVGVGKTFLAAALALLAQEITPKVLFLSSPDFIQACIHKTRFDEYQTIEEAAANRDLLVLDDLGSEYRGSGSGFSEQNFVNLLRSRVMRKSSTVITTNLSMPQVEEIYTVAFRSLLAEACLEITVKGADRRRDPKRREKMAEDAGLL